MPGEAEFYEVHIIKSDGAHWCGHTDATRDDAIKAAEKAIEKSGQPPQDFKIMEVFECRLVDTIELNP